MNALTLSQLVVEIYVWELNMSVLNLIPRFLSMLYSEVVPTVARVRLRKPRDLEHRLASHAKWLQHRSGSEGERLMLFHRDLREVDFDGADLQEAILFDCDLRGATFATRPDDPSRTPTQYTRRMTGSDLSYSRLEGAAFVPREDKNRTMVLDVSGMRLVGCSGLYGTDTAHLGVDLVFSPTDPPRIQRWGHTRNWGDLPSWETMKLLGTLPILGVSNIVVASILVYSAAARWYNGQVQKLVELASEPSSDPLLVTIASTLRFAPAPSHLGSLLLAFLGLTAANLVFRTQCPTIVQEYSRYSAFGRPYESVQRITYLAATYSSPIARYFCFGIMALSGGYIVLYLYRRVFEAITFFFPGGLF